MNCMHCEAPSAAVAVCSRCGAGACAKHAQVVTLAARPAGLMHGRSAARQVLCTAC
jgi:hypothetical protein